MHVTKDGKTKQPSRIWYTRRETELIYAEGGHVVLTLRSTTPSPISELEEKPPER